MKLGNVTWACDRCGTQKQQPADSQSLPFGWQRMEFPPSYKRDMCPKCINEYRAWWYGKQAAEALVAK